MVSVTHVKSRLGTSGFSANRVDALPLAASGRLIEMGLNCVQD
jgi:hypothetical protein